MEKSEIKEKIKYILTAVLGHQSFEMKDDLTAKDVEGWDSLSHMEIITGIEKEFSVKFKLKELNKLKNMGTLVDLVQSKL
jgi:acyl carrier protein